MNNKQRKINLILFMTICVLSLAIVSINLPMYINWQNEEQEKPLDFTEIEEPEYIDIPAVESLKFDYGTENQEVNFYNPKSNKCYFRISILLSDSTVIYQSGYISPGESVKKIKLNQMLKRGIYENCLLVYNCYSIEDYHEQNGGQFKISIYSN